MYADRNVGCRSLIALVQIHIWLWNLVTTEAEIFSSMENLRRLMESERGLMDILDDALDDNQVPTVKIKRFNDVFHDRHRMLSRASSSLHPAEHPIDALLTIKSWAKFNTEVLSQSSVLEKNVTDFLHKEGSGIPVVTDYEGAVAALVRLQRVYKLPTSQLIQGNIHGYKSLGNLDSGDMYHIGLHAKDTVYETALEWLEASVRMSSIRPASFLFGDKERQDVYVLLAFLYEKKKNYSMALEMINIALKQGINSTQEIMDIRQGLLRLNSTHPNSAESAKWRKTSRGGNYEMLCRGDAPLNDITVNPSLVCGYRHGNLPYVRYKEEIHSWEPRISLLVDVITDKEMESLKQLAYPLLFRSEVGLGKNKKVAGVRVSKQAWVWDSESTLALKLSRRVEDMAGLSTTFRRIGADSEAFQILNYGMGGQYEPHHDYFSKLETGNPYLDGTGNRITTLMFYLNDVVRGGATVFPKAGVQILPRKNAAAFWYNLRLNGEKDKDTLHAGCPVLLGQKWAANKWIRYNAQWNRRRCGLQYTATQPRNI